MIDTSAILRFSIETIINAQSKFEFDPNELREKKSRKEKGDECLSIVNTAWPEYHRIENAENRDKISDTFKIPQLDLKKAKIARVLKKKKSYPLFCKVLHASTFALRRWNACLWCEEVSKHASMLNKFYWKMQMGWRFVHFMES